MEEYGSAKEREEGLAPYLSPLGAWGLAVGTAIGWGSFLFTTTHYLEKAGPVGSIIGMLIGMAIMLFICRNYHFLMNAFPSAGGVYSFIKHVFGYDRAFLGFWYVMLAYLAMLWANATAVPIFIRSFFGEALEVGYLYSIFGYKIYAGEVLITMAIILLTGVLCMKRERHAVKFATALTLTFTIGITAVSLAVGGMHLTEPAFTLDPKFIPSEDIFPQILAISLITPWAFIGFENISHSAREFKFSREHSFAVLAASVVTTTALYIFVILLSIGAYPADCTSWLDYLRKLAESNASIKVLPPFYVAYHYLGATGFAVLAVSLLALIITSLIGNTVALSRLFYQVAKDDVLPDRFGDLNARRNPEKAVFLIMIASVGVPLLGRTAVGWIVDVLVICAVIVYGLVSAAAFKLAGERGCRLERFTGLIGMIVMGALGLVQLFPGILGYDTLETETYFLLSLWSVGGFLFLRNVLHRDYARYFGRSISAWVVLLGLIAFVALGWMRLENGNFANMTMEKVRDYYNGKAPDAAYAMGEEPYMMKLREAVAKDRVFNNSLVLILFMLSLGMFFSNYSVVQKRSEEDEKELHHTRALAYRDPMTGVKSKQAYMAELAELEKRIAQSAEPEPFAMLVCDVNGLKYINDTYGHKAGDEYICAASELICRNFKYSPVFRTGGDEFVVIMRGHGFERRCESLENLNAEVEANVRLEGKVVVAAGLADFIPGKDKNVHDTFVRADALMYERKMALKRMGAKTRS